MKISNDTGSVTSSAATLSVIVDTTAPTVVKANSDTTFASVLVKYSEPVSDTALTTSNYSIDQGVSVSAVARVDASTVRLTTSTLGQGKTYTLTIHGVQDIATTPNTIAANTQAQFQSFVFLSGTVVHKKYDNFGDAATYNDLFNDPRFPDQPDRVDLESMWEYPANGAGRDSAADPTRDYIDTIEGYFIPPTTGSYVFFTCGADHWWLFLSTDDDPANKHLITAEPGGWTNPRNWITGQGGTDMTVNRSDYFTATEWPDGGYIALNAGQRYYMLEVHQSPSWSGADDFSATYKLDTEADPVDGDPTRLTGSLIGSYIDPAGTSVTITKQPQDVVGHEGIPATLSVIATGSSLYGSTVFYQWQSAPKGSSTWQDIPGATTASYQTPLLTLADDGTQYRVIATVPPISETSSVATVTVTIDTSPPVATAGATVDSTDPNVVDIGIGFDETVDEASAKLLSNYSVSSGTIASLTIYTNRFTANSQNPLAMILRQSVLLKVTGLTGSGTLTVNNIADAHGNKMSSTAIPFTVNTKMKWGVVGANELGGWNAAVPVAPNGFDVYSDGISEWSQYDEATFVYEQVTGDFDKKVRVQYQDGSTTWARAGLIARDVLNFGVDRATQNGTTVGATTPPFDGTAGQYQKIHVNPVGATLSGAGNANWEGNRRLDTGGPSDGPIPPNAVPQYPNAWCRLQRVGQTFTLYRSDDGVNWVQLGKTTWGVDDLTKTPMPDTLYVGPEFSPESGSVTQAEDQGTFLAQFRDYGDYIPSTTFDPQLKITKDATGKVTITWTTGTLMSAPTLDGAYTAVNGASSPFDVTSTGQATFYRVKQ